VREFILTQPEPPQPNWYGIHRSVKECLSKMILFGEAASVMCFPITLTISQRKKPSRQANVILFPAPADRIGESSGEPHA